MLRNLFKLLRNTFYHLIIRLIPVSAPRKKYYVSLCAIFRNEGAYLREWLEFHRLIGVEHFYLYNNFSDDNFHKILQPYITAGLVTLIDWPHKNGQSSAYNHCLQHYKDETSWLGFIDLDEFVVPNRYANLGEWLQKHQRLPMAFAYWKFFSTKGRMQELPDILVAESSDVASHLQQIQKMFFNTAWYPFIKNFHIAHLAKLKYFRTFVPDKPMLFYGFQNGIDDPDIQINHYYGKSYEYQHNKKIAYGSPTVKNKHDFEQFFNIEKKACYHDGHIFPWLIQLKLALQKEVKRQ